MENKTENKYSINDKRTDRQHTHTHTHLLLDPDPEPEPGCLIPTGPTVPSGLSPVPSPPS